MCVFLFFLTAAEIHFPLVRKLSTLRAKVSSSNSWKEREKERERKNG